METPAVSTSLPGPRSAPLLAARDRLGYAALRDSHAEVPFVMAAKRGSIIEDADGNTFADHVSGWGATPLGATPEPVLEAVSAAHRTAVRLAFPDECTTGEEVRAAMVAMVTVARTASA